MIRISLLFIHCKVSQLSMENSDSFASTKQQVDGAAPLFSVYLCYAGLLLSMSLSFTILPMSLTDITGPHVPWSLVSVHNVLSPLCAGLPLTACAPRPGPGSLGRHWPGQCSHTRDSKGISELPLIQLTLPYKISCIRVSLEIPIISLGHTRDGTQTLHSANIASLAIYGGTMLIAASMANQELRGPGHNSLMIIM